MGNLPQRATTAKMMTDIRVAGEVASVIVFEILSNWILPLLMLAFVLLSLYSVFNIGRRPW